MYCFTQYALPVSCMPPKGHPKPRYEPGAQGLADADGVESAERLRALELLPVAVDGAETDAEAALDPEAEADADTAEAVPVGAPDDEALPDNVAGADAVGVLLPAAEALPVGDAAADTATVDDAVGSGDALAAPVADAVCVVVLVSVGEMDTVGVGDVQPMRLASDTVPSGHGAQPVTVVRPKSREYVPSGHA